MECLNYSEKYFFLYFWLYRSPLKLYLISLVSNSYKNCWSFWFYHLIYLSKEQHTSGWMVTKHKLRPKCRRLVWKILWCFWVPFLFLFFLKKPQPVFKYLSVSHWCSDSNSQCCFTLFTFEGILLFTVFWRSNHNVFVWFISCLEHFNTIFLWNLFVRIVVLLC